MRNKVAVLTALSILFICTSSKIFTQGWYANGSRINLGQPVNDAAEQWMPVFSPDGKWMYLVQNTGFGNSFEVWRSKSEGNTWGKPSLVNGLNPPILGASFFLFGFVHTDWLLIYGTYKLNNGILVQQPGLSFYPANYPPVFNPALTVPLTFDGAAFDFSKRPSVYYDTLLQTIWLSLPNQGQMDLYFSRPLANLSSEKFVLPLFWSAPANAGSDINTSYNETTPFAEANGVTICFSSDRPEGYGQLDIYSSNRLDSTFTHWTKPRNVGYGINNDRNDFFVTRHPITSMLYFSAYKNTLGGADIFSVQTTLPKFNKLAIPPLDKRFSKDSSVAFKDADITLITGLHKPNHLVFLLDNSNSMGALGKMQQLKESMEVLMQALRPEDKISLITFGSDIKVMLNQVGGKFTTVLQDSVNSLQAFGGGTNISKAIEQAYQIATSGFSIGGNNQLFLISDGNFILPNTQQKIITAHPEIQLTAVLVGENQNALELLQLLVQKVGGELVKVEGQDVNVLLKNVVKRSKINLAELP